MWKRWKRASSIVLLSPSAANAAWWKGEGGWTKHRESDDVLTRRLFCVCACRWSAPQYLCPKRNPWYGALPVASSISRQTIHSFTCRRNTARSELSALSPWSTQYPTTLAITTAQSPTATAPTRSSLGWRRAVSIYYYYYFIRFFFFKILSVFLSKMRQNKYISRRRESIYLNKTCWSKSFSLSLL